MPVKPVISGPPVVNRQETGLVYTVTNAQEIEVYTWTVPASVRILSGQGSSNLTVKWGNNPGNIGCTASNSCGSSVKTNYYVTTGSSFAKNYDGSNDKINQLPTPIWVTPNPAQGHAKVIFTIRKTGKCAIELSDIKGRLLLKKEVNAIAGINEIDLNMYNYATGTYLISVISGEERKTVRLIKGK